MPVSKRDKKVSLTKTKKKGMKLKQEVVEKIRKTLDKYDKVYLFTVDNQRNGLLKQLREAWVGSGRFFLAKRKVMAIALGRSEADEVQTNLHKLSMMMVGQCGLLLTNKSPDEVVKYFDDYTKMDFARSGFVATETVELPEGPLSEFTFSMEPHLRQLGLPTKLEKGKIVLREKFVVCTKGVQLTPEQANILKLLGRQMAEFKLNLVCLWSKDGTLQKLKGHTKLMSKSPKQIVKDTSMQETKTPQQKEIKTKKTKESSKKEVLDNDTSETPKQISKAVSKSFTPVEAIKTLPPAETPKPMDVDNGDVSEIGITKESPKIGKANLRRSMRTPKPHKRTPEQKKQSLKKLTVAGSKLNTPKQQKNTPKQASTKKT